MNKVVTDIETGFKRVRNIASPPNAVRLNKKTPCTITGKCENCYSPDCICGQFVMTRHSIVPNRIKVILIGEELGYQFELNWLIIKKFELVNSEE